MSGYGEVVRETAEERHERLLNAIYAVLIGELKGLCAYEALRSLAEECLAAVEAGF